MKLKIEILKKFRLIVIKGIGAFFCADEEFYDKTQSLIGMKGTGMKGTGMKGTGMKGTGTFIIERKSCTLK
jgi:hypothetical protein